MAIDVVMPRLGWGMEAGSLVEWIKKDGDMVQVGDIICTIEGDKAVNEIESMDSGVLRIPPDSPAVGTVVPVGTVLAFLVAPGEAAPATQAPTQVPQVQQDTAASVSPTLVEAVSHSGRGTQTNGSVPAAFTDRGEPAISPRARRVAAELGVEWTMLEGSGRTGRIVERDVRAAAAISPVTRVTPLARRVARDVGVDLQDLGRLSPSRRITRADVEEAAREQAPAAIESTPQRVPAAMGGVRRIIAARLSESMRTVVPVTLTTEADATELVNLRERIKADLAGTPAVVPTYNDLLARLVALVLVEHPQLNASLIDGAIMLHPTINIGIAVDTERGLLVPVVRDVASTPVLRIAEQAARVVAAARSGRIAAEDLHGATFTITNLGMYEIDAFTPIINLPECAILGIGRIVARPIVIDEAASTVAVRKMMALSLTFDHRLVDGAPAARFLQRVKQFIEHPTLWLIR